MYRGSEDALPTSRLAWSAGRTRRTRAWTYEGSRPVGHAQAVRFQQHVVFATPPHARDAQRDPLLHEARPSQLLKCRRRTLRRVKQGLSQRAALDSGTDVDRERVAKPEEKHEGLFAAADPLQCPACRWLLRRECVSNLAQVRGQVVESALPAVQRLRRGLACTANGPSTAPTRSLAGLWVRSSVL